MTQKPDTASGYTREETDQVVAACLTIAGALGDLMDDVCIVGGLVPSLIIDLRAEELADEEGHCGTNDLDVALAVALLDDARYKEISDRLRRESFEPDSSTAGNPTPQRWRKGELKVTIDFLMAPAVGEDESVRIKHLEGDFAALVTPGLHLAFDEQERVRLEGHNLDGQRLERSVPVCGPAAFVVLKAFAFALRTEPKDAYDLVYVLASWPGGTSDIADRLARHAEIDRVTVAKALSHLSGDFASVDHHGPQRAAMFNDADERGLDERAADAHGYVDDLLRACAERGLEPAES